MQLWIIELNLIKTNPIWLKNNNNINSTNPKLKIIETQSNSNPKLLESKMIQNPLNTSKLIGHSS